MNVCSGSSVNTSLRLLHHQGCCRVNRGRTDIFRDDFIRMACQRQQPPADQQEVVISPSAPVQLRAGGGSPA